MVSLALLAGCGTVPAAQRRIVFFHPEIIRKVCVLKVYTVAPWPDSDARGLRQEFKSSGSASAAGASEQLGVDRVSPSRIYTRGDGVLPPEAASRPPAQKRKAPANGAVARKTTKTSSQARMYRDQLEEKTATCVRLEAQLADAEARLALAERARSALQSMQLQLKIAQAKNRALTDERDGLLLCVNGGAPPRSTARSDEGDRTGFTRPDNLEPRRGLGVTDLYMPSVYADLRELLNAAAAKTTR